MSTFPREPQSDEELANLIDADTALEELSEELDRELTDAESKFDGAIELLTKERDDYREQHLRAMADLQNARKRFAQERQDIHKYATEKLVTDLVPVLDNFERTIAAVDSGATLESILEGVRLIDRQLRSVLTTVRLSRIESKGQMFDPEQHEAVATTSVVDVPDGTIIDELEPGYKLADRVIRPARVRVAKKS